MTDNEIKLKSIVDKYAFGVYEYYQNGKKPASNIWSPLWTEVHSTFEYPSLKELHNFEFVTCLGTRMKFIVEDPAGDYRFIGENE